MAAVHDTAYPRLTENVTVAALQQIYSPSEREIVWSRTHRLNAGSRLLILVYLKCFQRLGYFPRIRDIPKPIISSIAKTLNCTSADWLSNVPSSTQSRLQIKVRLFVDVTKYSVEEHGEWLKETASQLAMTKENTIDIINALLEYLIKEQIELPAFSTLNRIAINARAQANQKYYAAIVEGLSGTTIKMLDNVLLYDNGEGQTLWHLAKQEPEKPSITNLQRFIDHTRWLKNMDCRIGALPPIPEQKRQQFYFEAIAYARDKMVSLTRRKRIALIAILIREQRMRSTDSLIGLFVKEIRKCHNKAKLDLTAFQDASTGESEKLVCMLRDVTLAMRADGSMKKRYQQIEAAVNHDPQAVTMRCDRLVIHGFNNPLQFLTRRYTPQLRRGLLDTLSILDIDHTAHGGQLLSCVNAILHYRGVALKSLAVQAVVDFDENAAVPLDWVRDSWHSILYGEQRMKIERRFLDRNAFELCVLSEVSRRLQSGDLFVNSSTKYDDYRTHLVSWAEYDRKIDSFCEMTGFDKDPQQFVSTLKRSFVETARNTDKKVPDDSYLVINHGTLTLKKRHSQKTAVSKAIDRAIRDLTPPINIVDLLVETTRWTKIDRRFGPLSGNQRKIREYNKRLVATLFCYGCNLGPTQTARSIKEISRQQVSYLNISHSRDKDIQKATSDVINSYNHYDLPKFWGTGDTASVDGTRFDMYEQNMLSEYHLRYASYGGIGYYLVSDQYIALFSRFIPCGVREALHLIDGILENDSDIQPDTIHGDTHAQSTVVFGLAHLLGIKLMPRIKDINSLIFFKPDGRINFKHIESLFSEPINYALITDNLKDMLRVVVSISEGKVTASTVIRRLGSHGIRNSLFYAFRELGRLVRTQFLLDYISNIELRETVQAATCKSEEFNQFVQWVFFCNHGVIRENLRFAQEKMISFNHLVANLVILHNVDTMSKAIRKLKREGMEIPDEALRRLSPYRNEHINLLGEYTIDIPNNVPRQHTKLS